MLPVLLLSLVAVDDEDLELGVRGVLIGLSDEVCKRLHEGVARWAVLCSEEHGNVLRISLD